MDEHGKSFFGKDIFDKSLRLLLRSVPLFPMPEMYDLVLSLKQSRTELADKVHRAADALAEASKVVDELEDALKLRHEQMERIRVEYDRLSALTEVEADKAAAILSQVQVTLNRGRGWERWVSLGINLVAGVIVFFIGVCIGPWLTRILGISQT